MDLLNEIVKFYMNSNGFNGIEISKLACKLGKPISEFSDQLADLIAESKISINFGDRHPNPHIKAYKPEPAQEQIKKLRELIATQVEGDDTDTEGFRYTDASGEERIIEVSFGGGGHHVCVYPEGGVLPMHVDPTRYEGRPFSLRLALGDPQLHYEKFDLSILEYYRNDPRFHYFNNDISGRICIKDEYFDDEKFPESEKIYCKHLGFATMTILIGGWQYSSDTSTILLRNTKGFGRQKSFQGNTGCILIMLAIRRVSGARRSASSMHLSWK